MKVDCFSKLKKSYADIDEDILKEIFEDIDSIKGSSNFNARAKEIRLGREIDQKAKAEAQIRQLLTQKEVLQRVENNSNLKGNEHIEALLTGTSKLSTGGNNSVLKLREGVSSRLLSRLDKDIEGLGRAYKRGDFDIEIAEAADIKLAGGDISKLNPTVQQGVKALLNNNAYILKIAKEMGFPLRELKNYFSRHTHDITKIGKAGFQEWSSAIKSKLDKSSPFEGGRPVSPEVLDKHLKEMYDNLKKGEFEGFRQGTGSSGSRALKFESEKAWAEYNKQFGYGSIHQTAIASINSFSRTASSHNKLGPFHQRTLDAVERRVRKDLSPKELQKFDSDSFFTGGKRHREALIKETFGHDRVPGQNLVGEITRTIQTVVAGSKLSLAVFSTPTDLATTVGNFMVVTGKSGATDAISSSFKAMGAFFKSLSAKDRKAYGQAFELYSGSLNTSTLDRYGVFGGGGRLNSFLEGAITVTGLGLQTTASRMANAKMLAFELSMNVKKNYSKLNESTKANLKRFDIDETNWDSLKEGIDNVRGVDVVTPEALRAAGKNKLADSYGNYLRDNADVGTPQASIKEKAFISQGLSPDDLGGAGLRLMGQFKSFSLATPRILRRIAKSNPNHTPSQLETKLGLEGKLSTYAAVIAGSTVMAAVGLAARKMAKNEEPEFNKEFWVESFSRAALPLMSTYMLDVLRGEYDKFGRSILKDLAGPSIGQLDQVAGVASSAVEDVVALLEGEVTTGSKAGQKALKLIHQNLPGHNLPIVKSVLDTMVMDNLHDMMNPGYKARKELRDINKDKLFDL